MVPVVPVMSCGVGPGQGLGGVGAHQPGVAVAGQVCPGGGVIPLVLGVAVEEGGQLLPGDGIACPEVVEETPPVMSFSQAQVTASWNQAEAGTSQKGFSQSAAGWPARR